MRAETTAKLSAFPPGMLNRLGCQLPVPAAWSQGNTVSLQNSEQSSPGVICCSQLMKIPLAATQSPEPRCAPFLCAQPPNIDRRQAVHLITIHQRGS